VPDELMQEEVTREAVQYLEQHSYTKDELLAYEEYRDAILVQRAFIEDAEEKGEAKGKEEGEAKKLIEMVTTGYQNGLSIEQIHTYFNLDIKQIEEILKSNNIKK
jgi:predicted transposase/invertase (TIGR01784 family)